MCSHLSSIANCYETHTDSHVSRFYLASRTVNKIPLNHWIYCDCFSCLLGPRCPWYVQHSIHKLPPQPLFFPTRLIQYPPSIACPVLNSNFSESIVPTHIFDNAPGVIEVLIIPGGVGTRAFAPTLDHTSLSSREPTRSSSTLSASALA